MANPQNAPLRRAIKSIEAAVKFTDDGSRDEIELFEMITTLKLMIDDPDFGN